MGSKTNRKLLFSGKEQKFGVTRNKLTFTFIWKIIRRSINVTEGLLPNNFTGYNIVQPEDIVLRMTDLQNDHVSLRTGLVQEKGIITSAYITIRKGIYSEIDSYYIHLFLYSFDVNKGFYGMGSGVRQGITFNDIKKFK
ncbi:hypothetical protein ACIL82_09920 [Enterococcus faecium]